MSENPPIDIKKAKTGSSKTHKKQSEIVNKDLLEDINARYAFAMYGSGNVIIKTDETPVKFFTEESFKAIHYNKYVVNDAGESKKLGHSWLGWSGRREYRDVVFYPGYIDDQRVYNLWQGFAYTQIKGDCSLFLDHVLANVCGGDEALYNWVLDWMADAIQKPHRKNWTALLLQSVEEGTGKGFFANHFGKLFGYHYRAFNKPGQLLGKFNSHLEDKLIVFLDEGSLVEKYAYDFAKSLITEPTLNIEPKGRSIREVNSYHRLIVASNDQQIIRASLHDRRWCVLRVKPHARNNLAYFDEIEKQLADGGYEALMWLLLTRQYKDHDVKTTPKTQALNDQKDHNLSTNVKWWRSVLMMGKIHRDLYSTVLTSELYQNYLKWCDEMRVNRRESEDWLPRRLNEEINAGLKSKGGGGMGRYYELPTLSEARIAFEEALGYKTVWED